MLGTSLAGDSQYATVSLPLDAYHIIAIYKSLYYRFLVGVTKRLYHDTDRRFCIE